MDKKLVLLISIFFVTFGTFISIVFTRSQQPASIKAVQNQSVDINNSLLFSVPFENGCKISAVVNDAKNRPIKDIEVCFETDNGQINPPCAPTDGSGIITTRLIDINQTATIKAKVSGQYFSKTVNCQPALQP